MEFDNRTFNRSNYSKKTIDIFEIITAYFVDIYYNHLYIEAKKFKNDGKIATITEGYKHTLNAFIQGIENIKHYKKTLVSIHVFFVEHGGYTSLSFTDCIDKITNEFIPKDYLSVVTKQQKITILKKVICQSNRVFVEKIVRKFLRMIIDDHVESDNIRVLQDDFVDLLILERENIYHMFIDKHAKKSTQKLSSGVVESMQAEIKKLYSEKYELKKMATSMKKVILMKDSALKDKESQIDKLMESITELEKENFNLSQQQLNLSQQQLNLSQQQLQSSQSSMINNTNTYIDYETEIAGAPLVLEQEIEEQEIEEQEEYKKDISKIYDLIDPIVGDKPEEFQLDSDMVLDDY
jgi:hypothetical protein